MKFARQLALLGCAVVSFFQVACVAAVDGDQDGEEVAEAQEEILVRNGLAMNGLSMNGLSMNGLSMNGFTANALTRNALTRNALTVNALTANALTADALTANAVTREALRESGTRELLSYVVSCALPEQDRVEIEVEGVSHRFAGGLGLAPEWGQARGSCDQRCQESVSACLLARVNYLGEHIQISLRGKSRALSTTKEERETYETPEATYYGNVFLAEQRRFACLPPGATSIPRVCGPSLDGCVVDVVGACEEVCEHTSPDGSYWNCHDHAPVEGRGVRVYPRGADDYRKSPVSVFLD